MKILFEEIKHDDTILFTANHLSIKSGFKRD